MLPVVLLLAVGALLAASIILAKAAAGQGVLPAEFAFYLSVGSGTVLLLVALLGRNRILLSRQALAYYLATGLLSIAAPNVINFEVARRIGAGYAAVSFALSPLITYGLAILAGVDKPSLKRIAGVALGLIGTAFIVLDVNGRTPDVPPIWFAIALTVPLLVAAGNIYRTLKWPAGAEPMPLAAGMMLAAAVLIAPIAFSRPLAAFSPAATSTAHILILAQVVISSLTYWLFFRLQVVAGPVYLSQIGYVSAAIGVVAGLVIFGEAVTLPMILGFALIVAGVVLVTPRAPPIPEENRA
jgi:drug/metabolite transporter (DMT)-like permease